MNDKYNNNPENNSKFEQKNYISIADCNNSYVLENTQNISEFSNDIEVSFDKKKEINNQTSANKYTTKVNSNNNINIINKMDLRQVSEEYILPLNAKKTLKMDNIEITIIILKHFIGFISSLKCCALNNREFFKANNNNSEKNQLNYESLYLVWIYITLTLTSSVALIFITRFYRNSNYNYILLLFFAIFEAKALSFQYIIVNNWKFFPFSIIVTFVFLLFLKRFSCSTTTDYTDRRRLLSIITAGLFIFSIIISWEGFFANLFLLLSVALFAGYVVVDTQILIGKFSTRYSINDSIIGNLNISVDSLTIYWSLVLILNNIF
jgi:hypothetical protein